MNENIENNINENEGNVINTNPMESGNPIETNNANANMQNLNSSPELTSTSLINNSIEPNYAEFNYQNNVGKNNQAPKEKKKNKGLIIGLIIVIALVIVVVGGFLYIKNTYNAKSFLTKNANTLIATVDKTFDALSINDDLLKNIEKYDIINDAKITLKSTSSTLKSLNNLEINFNEKMNLNDNFMSLDLGLKQDSNSVSGNLIYIDNKLYVDSKDLYNDMLFVNLDENVFANVDEYINQLKNFANIEEFENSLKNLIKYAEVALQEATITTKMSGLDVTYTYEINESNINKIVDKLIEQVKNDNKLMEYFENDTSSLEILKESVQDIYVTIKIKLFTNEIESFAFDVNGSKIEGTKTEKNKYKIIGADETVIYLELKDDSYIFTDDNNNKITLVNSKNKLAISANANNSIMELSIENNKDTSTIIAKLDSEGITANVNLKVNQDSKNKKSSVTGTIDITYNNENLTINLSNNSQYGNNLISKPNVANAKNYEQLTEDETNVIMFNAYSKLGAFDLFKDLSSIIGNIDNAQGDNDDDYNFDDLNDYDFDDTEF